MSGIDLDSIGSARREGKKEHPVVTFGGKDFELPVEMPFSVVEAVSRMDASEEEQDNLEGARAMRDIAESLFGTRYREFLQLGPSMEDITALLEHISEVYGTSTGESEASES